MNKNKYYSLNPLLSHNGYLNIVMSGRGTGKSFSGKKQVIKNWEKNQEQAIYVRRTKAEMDNIKDTYWNDIKEFYPQYEFHVQGDVGYINKEPVIYFIPLSTSPQMKSASFPKATLMLFDEYIITKTSHNRYLKNEMTLLFDLIETVFRDRQKVKILLMSNSVSYVNPLFTFFNIVPNTKERFQKFKNGLIVLEQFSSPQFMEEKRATSFGRLIEGSAYSDYAIGNQTLEDSDDFIKPRSSGKHHFLCSIKHQDFIVGVWWNQTTLEVYMDKKIDPSSPYQLALTPFDMEVGMLLLKEQRKTFGVIEIKSSYNNGRLYFSSQEVKVFFLENILKWI